jgi:hypothetical protein
MRTLQVHFSSGRDVLGRYWGMLRGGGLRLDLPMLPEPTPAASSVEIRRLTTTLAPAVWSLDETMTMLPAETQLGERLQLQIHVLTIKKTFAVLAQLLELTHLPEGVRAVIGFLPESPADELLDAVWADGLNVPQRRSRRHELLSPVQFTCVSAGDGSLQVGELRNLSLGGCCIAGPALPPLGSHVMVQVCGATLPGPELAAVAVNLSGRVRWTECPDAGLMGIEFQSPNPTLAQLLETLS